MLWQTNVTNAIASSKRLIRSGKVLKDVLKVKWKGDKEIYNWSGEKREREGEDDKFGGNNFHSSLLSLESCCLHSTFSFSLSTQHPADTSHGKSTARLGTKDNEHSGNNITTRNHRQQHHLMTTSHTKQSFQLSVFTGAQQWSQEVQTIEQCLPRPLHSLPFNRSLCLFISVRSLKFKGLIFSLQDVRPPGSFIYFQPHSLSSASLDFAVGRKWKRVWCFPTSAKEASSSSPDSTGGHQLIPGSVFFPCFPSQTVYSCLTL